MELHLRGKLALVTGASRGIGRAVAETLAEEGCDLILAARSSEGLTAVADGIRIRCNVGVTTIACDLSLPADQARLAEKADSVDILINNAGANPGGEIDDIDEALWRRSWDLKVFGYVALTRSFYTSMKARRGGVIVNVIGNSGERMNARYILGSTGNSALMSLTRALGARSPDFNVRVVGVNPGLTATDRGTFMLKGWSRQRFGTEDRWQELQAEMNLPFGRMGEAQEVADTVVFLASPRAGYTSGTIVTVDGGAAHREG